MAKPFQMTIVGDVRDFIRGTRDVEGALDEVADSLDDLGREDVEIADGIEDQARDASRAVETATDDMRDNLERVGDEARDAGDELGDRIDDGAKEAEDGADRVERSFRDAMREVGDRSKTAGDSIGREVKRGTREAEEGFGDLKDEAGSSGREAAQSFSGEFDDITDFVQEIAANAFEGFGPLGAAAGIAAAVGIGVLTTEFEKAKEEAQETAEHVSDIVSEMIELGTTDTSAQQIEQRLREAAETAEDGSNNLERWGEMAEAAGVSTEDFALAMVGDMEAAERVSRQAEQASEDAMGRFEESRDMALDAGNAYGIGMGEAQDELTDTQAAIGDVRGALEEQAGETEAAADIFDYYNRIVREGPDAQAEYAEAVREMEEQTADYLTSAGENWEEYVTDGELALDEYNASIERHILAVEQYEQNMVTASETLSDEALNYLRELGPEAAPLLQAFVDAPLEEQERTADNWHTLGVVASDGYDSGLDLAGPTGLEISRAQGIASANPIQVPVELSGADLSFQIGSLVGSMRPPAVEVPVITKAIL